MKPPSKLAAAAQHAVFLLAGCFLLYLAFRNQSLDGIWARLSEARWEWPLLILGISLLNHASRALRWQLLLEASGPKPGWLHAFLALMFGYLVNLAVPRLGEISRCSALYKTARIPFRPALGTVVAERLLDIACLGLAVLLAIAFEWGTLQQFYRQELHPVFADLLSQKPLGLRIAGIGAVMAFALGLAYLLLRWRMLRRRAGTRRLLRFLLQIWKGIRSIAGLRRPGLFIGHTLFIWGTYYLMTRLWFYCFDETAHLGAGAGLAMLAIGSLARSLPIQGGGMGAYHYLFVQGLLLYGIDASHGQALAIMIHGLQLLLFLVLGGASALGIALWPAPSAAAPTDPA